MDSGNSESLQSSSGDEEYDSRAGWISSALPTTDHHHHPPPAAAAASHRDIGPISNTNPQQPPPAAPDPSLNTTNTSTIFDPLSNYFDTISRPPQDPNSSLLNLEMSWSKTLRSYPNSTEINPNPMMVSASSIQSVFASNQQLGSFTTTNQSSIALPVQENNCTSAANIPRQAPPGDQNSPSQSHVVRNQKKRPRASRRAPTTVLTTDTTNFRAMVQEFTGIPAPPFTSSSPFHRARLDLYGTSTTSSMRSNSPLDSTQQQPFLRRHFPQKVQLPSSFFASSSSSCSLLNSSLVDHAAMASPNTTTTVNISSSNNTYQLPPLNSNIFNLPNPILTSLLQSNNIKYPPTNCAGVGSKTTQSLDEFGLGQGNVNTGSLSGLPRLVSSDQTTSSNDNNPVNWGNAGNTVVGSNEGGGDQGHQNGSGNGNFSLSRINNAAGNGKLNYSGTSSIFHGDKGSSDNVAAAAAVGPPTRGEGMMESWICSSD